MFSSHRRTLLVGMALMLVFSVQAAFGQQVFGSIYGTVSDSTGGRVPNAKIVIIDDNKGNQYEVSTNEDGNYSKDRLIPGSYTLSVEAPGFAKAVNKGIQVSVDSSVRFDLSMQVGQVSETVEVSGSAPLLQSDRADVSTTFTGKQLVDLPRLDRNFQSYLLLSPGSTR